MITLKRFYSSPSRLIARHLVGAARVGADSHAASQPEGQCHADHRRHGHDHHLQPARCER